MKKITFVFPVLLSAALALGQTRTEKLEGSVNGRVYFDGTAFFKDKTHLGSGATISDIRLGVSGKYENFSGKIDIGFAKKTISLKDVFIQYNFRSNSYARIGHFAEPFGLDYMESSGNIRFINAGCVTEAFAPGRKLGLEYIGWSKNFWYAGGLFGDTHFDQRLDYKGNDGYALTARGVYNPCRSEEHVLHIGAAASFRTPDATKEGVAGRAVSYGANLGSMANSTKFVNADITDVNHTFKVTGEFIGAMGRFSLQGEYFYVQADRKHDLKTYKAWGTYGQMGFLAIGNGYEYATSWARLELPEPGSLEFAVRYSCLDLNDKETEILGGQQQQFTFGCNYYWKKFIRLRLNYNFAHLDKYALNGKENFHFISARIQVFLNS